LTAHVGNAYPLRSLILLNFADGIEYEGVFLSIECIISALDALENNFESESDDMMLGSDSFNESSNDVGSVEDQDAAHEFNTEDIDHELEINESDANDSEIDGIDSELLSVLSSTTDSQDA
jgi:hypothetical protein